MVNPRRLLAISAFAILYMSISCEARLHGSFRHFYLPELERILTSNPNCTQEFNAYRNESVVLYGTRCVKTFSCIMDNVDEYTKANMASATVLLGLVPLILASLGSTATEMAMVAAHRPLYGLALMLGAPALNPSRTHGFQHPSRDHLTKHRSHKNFPKVKGLRPKVYVGLQFTLAIANIVNVATLSWDLSLRTIPVMSCDSDMVVGLWIGLAAVTYCLVLMTFYSRLRLREDPEDRRTWRQWTSHIVRESPKLLKWRTWRYYIVKEFRYGANQEQLDATWDEESWLFLFLSWLTTLFAVVHLAYGILALSSLSFVGIEDATRIAARFMASAITTRQLVALEVACLRSSRAHIRPDDDGESGYPVPPTENGIAKSTVMDVDVRDMAVLRPVRSPVTTRSPDEVKTETPSQDV